MNRIIKLLYTTIALTLLVALPAGSALAANPQFYDLQAGAAGNRIGTVSVSDNGTDLIVEFKINDNLNPGDDFHLLKTHVLATDDDKLKGALATGAPGQFPYEHFPLADSKNDRFEISLADLGVTSAEDLIVAFHANVENKNDIIGYTDSDGVNHEEAGTDCPTLDDIAAALPEFTKMQIFGDGSGYYDVKIDLNGDGAFGSDELFDWYCIDETHNIGLGVYTVRVYSSYETLPDEIINNGTGDNNVDNPDLLDEVNWVINNPSGLSQSQVQDVIWALVDDAKTPADLDTAELLVYHEALTHDGFVPADGQNLAIVLQPVDASNNSVGQVTIGQVTIGQVSFGTLGLECQDWTPVFKGNTAWAIAEGGFSFPRSTNWGSYFIYMVD